jgi:beta-glucosidase
VRGFQGRDLADSTAMMATVKHFGAYGGAEGGRDYNTVDVSERTLRETYLPPYRAAIAAGAGSVMASFNEIAGVPSHANRWLLTDLLRGEWRFDGMVVSDWAGIEELVAHGRAATEAEAGRIALEAGVDMDMADSVYLERMPAGYGASGSSRAALDEAVRRVLRAKYRLGLFRDPYRGTSPAREQAVTLTPAHLALAREAARRSMVLLKNGGGVLPLRHDLPSLAVIGALADDSASMIGPWGGMGQAADVVTILQGIQRAVSPQTRVVYAPGAAVLGSDTSGFAAAEQAARGADAVVLVLGESANMSGEASSRAELGLPGVQQRLADRILATGKPVVVLLANGRPLAIPELAARAPAILETWFLGVQAGPAVADVVFGDVAPGGKLPVTFPRSVGQVPLYYDHKNTGRPPVASDHFTSKYLDLDWTPLFPFGYGLSYTTFAYGPLRLSATSMGPADTLVARVDVTNSGSRAGDEVVQLYIRDEVASITRPVKELRGFSRIALAPGHTRTVSFQLTADDLAFWGPAMKRIVEPGFFRVYAGTSSEQVQEARFELKAAPRH